MISRADVYPYVEGPPLFIGPLDDSYGSGHEARWRDSTRLAYGQPPSAVVRVESDRYFKSVYGRRRPENPSDDEAAHATLLSTLNLTGTRRATGTDLRLSFVLRRHTLPRRWGGFEPNPVYVFVRDLHSEEMERHVLLVPTSGKSSDDGIEHLHLRWDRPLAKQDGRVGEPRCPTAPDDHVSHLRYLNSGLAYTNENWLERNFLTGVRCTRATGWSGRTPTVSFDPRVHCERMFDLPDLWHLDLRGSSLRLVDCLEDARMAPPAVHAEHIELPDRVADLVRRWGEGCKLCHVPTYRSVAHVPEVRAELVERILAELPAARAS